MGETGETTSTEASGQSILDAIDPKATRSIEVDSVVDSDANDPDSRSSKSPTTRKRRNFESPSASRVSQSPPAPVNEHTSEMAELDHDGNGKNVSVKKRKISSKRQEKEDMSWICAECKEADCGLVMKQQDATRSSTSDQVSGDSFLICEGMCHRIFHVPCAGLAQIPDSDDEWLCKDCTRKEHACAFCSEYGQDNVDVFPCQDELCGLFFHEACLQTHHVDYNYHQTSKSPSTNDADLEQEEPPKIPSFRCPAHHCWTCTQKDMIQLEKEEEIARRQRNGATKNTNRKKKKKQSIFQSKPGRLFQCLYCPTAYHVTCLPPTSRFHELAVLCHEHAHSHRLPELDMTFSIQSKLEDKLDRDMMKMHGIRGSKSRKNSWSSGRGASSNPFFPGLRGDRFDSVESKMLACMKETSMRSEDRQVDPISPSPSSAVSIAPASVASMVVDGGMPFCLPVDMRNDVYAKPPTYIHIQSNKYNRDKDQRPKKIISDKHKCTCTAACDDNCYNRVTMQECTGPKDCNLGTKDCGNRSLGKRQFVKCQTKREPGKGWGLVTNEFIPKGKLVQEYMGEVIDEKEVERRMVAWAQEHPNDPNFYVMALKKPYFVDAREYANLARFINHSCEPNCKVTSVNVNGCIRNGIYSIRDIQPGEFLCYDYHFDTNQGDRFVCRCGSPNCRGTMKGMGKDGAIKRPQNWKEAKARLEADKKFLEEAEKSKVVSLVDVMLPCAEHPNETVASGPLEKHRDEAVESRIFLWRNVKLGADFISRKSKLEKVAVFHDNN